MRALLVTIVVTAAMIGLMTLGSALRVQWLRRREKRL